jgi:hypothetical protein
MIDQVKQALLKLDSDNPGHRELMKNWDEEFRYGFVVANDVDYSPIRRLINWLETQEIK